MGENRAALFYLSHHNEVDQISPILYKLGKRGNIAVNVVLENGVSSTDYRIAALTQFDTIRILDHGDSSSSQPSLKNQATELLKEIGRKIPTSIPEKFYQKCMQLTRMGVEQEEPLRIPTEFSDTKYGVIAFDWSHANSERTDQFAHRNDVTTIVLPHGDSPFVNNIEIQESFDRFVSGQYDFDTVLDLNDVGYKANRKSLKHDYMLYPNERTASRLPQSADEQIKILGSPRYNTEWLDVLSDIRPDSRVTTDADLNIVFFLRQENYFVSTSEVKNTLRLLHQFDTASTIVKEHPRYRLLDPSTVDEMKNIEIVKDEVSSASLIDWGDVFLSLGTTITFEPIMRKKPVLELEYAHANHTVVANYFSDADMRCKDDLYHIIHDFLETGTSEFYDESEHQTFVREMICESETSVLDSWAEFIEQHS